MPIRGTTTTNCGASGRLLRWTEADDKAACVRRSPAWWGSRGLLQEAVLHGMIRAGSAARREVD
jgi:hypothetical protein